MIKSRSLTVTAIAAVMLLGAAERGAAHCLWLKTDNAGDQPLAVLFFGESAFDEAYHLPERLADTEIWCRTRDVKRTKLSAVYVESDDRIGREAKLPAAEVCVLETSQQYGVYQTFLLTYYAKHIRAPANEELATAGVSPELRFDLVPRATDQGVELTALWDGKPRGNLKLTVTVDENDSRELTTDADGKATIRTVKAGLVSVLGSFFDESMSGEFEGHEYNSACYFVTLTFPWHKEAAKPRAETTSANAGEGAIPPLPEAVSSFGAAVCDNWLYVYSGHTGTEHDHSAANLSQHFRRLQLGAMGSASSAADFPGESSGTPTWEELPMQTPLQGLAMVAHDGKIYRVGGMHAHNATTDDEEDLHSTTDFACYDPQSREWSALTPLPEPRSSHNAVVIGDKLYVVGGWTLSGTTGGEWIDHSLVYDFADPNAGWRPLAKQSFQRRALAAGRWQGKLVALGGMDENADVSQRVDFFEPHSGNWSEGPVLPGAGMAGFGVSAWNLGGRLYCSGFRGRVYRFKDDGSGWEEVARLAKPRFFHQLVPGGNNALLAVGGASREGHLADIERIDVTPTVSAGSASARSTPDSPKSISDNSADS